MSVPNTNKASHVTNSGTRMGVHTDVHTDLTANTRVNNGGTGNRDIRKETHVHGGDARLRLQGSRLTGGSQHTSINMQPNTQPSHQSTIIFPQLSNPPVTTRPWADSAYGTYYVPSVKMSITVSVASTLSILLVFFLCRTYMGSKTSKLGRRFTKKANAAMERITGRGPSNDTTTGNMEMGSQGVSKTDLAHGVKTVNMLVARTLQLEQSLARQEQLLKDLAKADNRVPPAHAAGGLHDDAGEKDGPDSARQQPAQPQQALPHRRHRHGRHETRHPDQTQLTKGDLRTLFFSWTNQFFGTSKNSSPSEEGEEQTPRRQRNVSGESSRSGRKRTAPSPERDGTRDGVKGGPQTALYPSAELEELWTSFQEEVLNRRGQRKIDYSYTKDDLGY